MLGWSTELPTVLRLFGDAKAARQVCAWDNALLSTPGPFSAAHANRTPRPKRGRRGDEQSPAPSLLRHNNCAVGQRKVSQVLTLQHDHVIYLLQDTPEMRALVHRYIDVWEYPDGRIELRADGHVLPYARYDRLSQVDAGAVVENKRLGHALQVAQTIQAQRDDRRFGNTPSRTLAGEPVRQLHQTPGTKRQRQFTADDIRAAIEQVCSGENRSTRVPPGP